MTILETPTQLLRSGNTVTLLYKDVQRAEEVSYYKRTDSSERHTTRTLQNHTFHICWVLHPSIARRVYSKVHFLLFYTELNLSKMPPKPDEGGNATQPWQRRAQHENVRASDRGFSSPSAEIRKAEFWAALGYNLCISSSHKVNTP